ncbi:SIS domain-containing protein [Actinomadura sp. HBU206391]|uniref:SIS domain-containing protein n=1 Tax=Actinomadura sp. HBU206391 TaxID=2731692 RepID=UPI00164F07FA|nr:SIS domain-containing protein [Actinomadura sp. HBU206391]MBC6458363.1 SIS domain-containing protein [Actinomadura sp. HBU206391]
MHFPDGIAAQPDVLARSRETVTAALDRLAVPRPGQVIALVGIGASEYAAHGAAPAWRAAGLRAFPLPASEMLAAADLSADVYVAISESGRSAETVKAMEAVSGRTTVALTNEPGSPLTEVTDGSVHLGSGPDSAVYTTGYTATLQALGLIGERWSGHGGDGDWSALPDLAQRVLDDFGAVVDAPASVLDAARIVDVVASGSGNAAAGEGALLLRESAHLHTAAHETRNYLHGPMEPLDAQTACLIIGGGREVKLAQDVRALGCPTILITTREDVRDTAGLTVVRLPRVRSPLARAVLEILPIQLLGWSVASRRGLRVDGFRHRQHDTKLESA